MREDAFARFEIYKLSTSSLHFQRRSFIPSAFALQVELLTGRVHAPRILIWSVC